MREACSRLYDVLVSEQSADLFNLLVKHYSRFAVDCMPRLNQYNLWPEQKRSEYTISDFPREISSVVVIRNDTKVDDMTMDSV